MAAFLRVKAGQGETTIVGDHMPGFVRSPGSIIAFANNGLSLGHKKE